MKKSLRRSVRGALSVLIVAFLFSVNVLTAFADTGTIKANGVNVRSQPTVNSNPVGSVNAGATFEIEGTEKDATGMDWYKITVNGQTGYVRSDFVDVKTDGGTTGGETPAGETGTETPVEAPFVERNAVVSATAAINVRNDAGATYASVANLQPNTPVVVIGETTAADGAKWYKIRYNDNNEGYVLAAFLTVEEGEPAPTPGGTETPGGETGTETPGGTTPESPVTEDPNAGDNSGMMGQQYTVVYDLDNNDEMAPWLMDNNSGTRTNIQQLLSANQELVRLQSVEKSNTALKILSIILGIIALVAIVLLVMVVLRYRRYRDEDYDEGYDDEDVEEDGDFEEEAEEEEDRPKRSFFGRRKAASYDDEEEDEDEEEEDEDDDYDDDPPKKGGGFFSRFRRRRDDDYDDEDEDYDDEDDYEDEQPRAISRVYQPERTPEAESRTRRPRNFMDDDMDDYEYGSLNDFE